VTAPKSAIGVVATKVIAGDWSDSGNDKTIQQSERGKLMRGRDRGLYVALGLSLIQTRHGLHEVTLDLIVPCFPRRRAFDSSE
jgi:hypothetical protein